MKEQTSFQLVIVNERYIAFVNKKEPKCFHFFTKWYGNESKNVKDTEIIYPTDNFRKPSLKELMQISQTLQTKYNLRRLFKKLTDTCGKNPI